MILEILPKKLYRANIDKDESFHLETLEEATRSMVEVPQKDNKIYSSSQKRFWVDSPTYAREFENIVFKEIFDFIDKCAGEYLTELNVDPEQFEARMTSAYLNRCGDPVNGQSLHNHRGSLISFTYYFHLTEPIQPLILTNPLQNDFYYFPHELCTSGTTDVYSIYPNVGDVFLFSSHLGHEVHAIEEYVERWLFNGDYHIYSDKHPNLPNQT